MATAEIKLPTPHEKQQSILDESKRFNLVKTGRRFGKTNLIKELSSIAIDGKKVGIWFPVYKDLSKVWMNIKHLLHPIIKKKDESLKQIYLVTGGEIDFWSMEDPASGRGFDYDRAIIDEFAKAKKNEEAWNETIRPTLVDRAGDAYIFSTPKGKHNYFFQLQEAVSNKHNWNVFIYTSYDNPHLSYEEIEDARESLDDLTFRQEFLAEDVDKNERPYLYCYDESKHYGFENQILKDFPIWFSFDFNVDPMTCTVAQRISIREIRILENIQLDSSDIYDMTEYLKAKYTNKIYNCKVTGDASGNQRSGATKGKLSYWKIIKKELNLKTEQIFVRKANLAHEKSRPLVNSVLQHAVVKVNVNCKKLNNDLKYSAVDDRGQIIKTTMEGRHFFDTFRYLIDANFPDFLSKIERYT